MRRLVLVLLAPLAVSIAACSCGEYASGKPAVELRVEPIRLDFGVAWVGETIEREVRLENLGHKKATLRVQFDDADFEVVPAELEVPSGGEGTLIVSFTPSTDGTRQLELRLLGSGDRVEALLPVEGQGVAPAIELPLELDFGTVEVGGTTALQLVVHNRAPLAIPAPIVGFTGPDGAAFSPLFPLSELPAGDSALFDVAFTPLHRGRSEATLSIAACAVCEPSVVALSGAGVGAGFAAIPDRLDFEVVSPGGERTLELIVANVGELAGAVVTGDCDDPAFRIEARSWPIALEPGEQVPVWLTFSPAERGDREATALFVGTPGIRFAVPLTGRGGGAILEADPVELGSVALGASLSPRAVVRNVGDPESVTLVGARIEGSGAWRLGGAVAGLEVGLRPGTIPLSFNAGSMGRADGELVLFTTDREQRELRVPLGALVRDNEAPVPVCPGALSVVVNRPVTLDGRASDPNGDPIRCSWLVIDAPEGSTEQPAPPDACTSTFTPDAIGDYVLRFTATDEAGNGASCTTPLKARAPSGGLWVEMYWEQNSNDIDLHLLHGGGGDPELRTSWNSKPWDCFYGNDPASWDEPGAGDDCTLDRDVVSGAGVENIRVDQPSSAHEYHVGLAWFSRHGGSPTTQAVVTNVYCWGLPIANTTTTMTHPGPERPQKPMIFVGTIQFTPGGLCTWTPEGIVVP